MSQKEIKLYDDSVIKLTIKQGSESERFPITTINPDNILNFDYINSISGCLSSGELGWTRDTNRLFVGNIKDSDDSTSQATPGGVLAGNKYLGFVDSRSTTWDNSTPLTLGDNLLTNTSLYRSYNFDDSSSTDNSIKYTEDKKWPKLPYYNEKYDAYDGDYMYDAYRNAIILFDHNIKPENNPSFSTDSGALMPTMRGKRKTIFETRFHDKADIDAAQKTVYNHTKDMYGDGYVLFYNVIPDGDTLTFAPKVFDKNGVDDNEADANNYSYNIIKINRLSPGLVKNTLAEEHFTVSANDGLITLSDKITNSINSAGVTDFTNPTTGQIVTLKVEEKVVTMVNTDASTLGIGLIETQTGDLSWLNTNKVELGKLIERSTNLQWVADNLNEENYKNKIINSGILTDYYTKVEVDNTFVKKPTDDGDGSGNSSSSSGVGIDLSAIRNLVTATETTETGDSIQYIKLTAGTGTDSDGNYYIDVKELNKVFFLHISSDKVMNLTFPEGSITLGANSFIIPIKFTEEDQSLRVENVTAAALIASR